MGLLKNTHGWMRKVLDDKGPFGGKTLGLFKNNVSFSRNTVLGDLVPCDFIGYAPQDPVWGVAFQNGVEDVIAAPPITFTAGPGLASPQDVYGYFFLDEDGDLSWGQTFDGGPTTLSIDGQTIVIFPQWKDKNYFET